MSRGAELSTSDTSDDQRLTPAESLGLIADVFPAKDSAAEVIGVEFAPFSSEKLGFLGTHELLTIEARDKDGDETSTTKRTFFVKSVLSSLDAYGKFVFEEEYKFYRDVVPRLLDGFEAEPWSPDCRLIKRDFIVLEDLKASGYEITTNFLSPAELKAAVECLARFHASSMLLEEKLGRPLSEAYPGYFEEKTFKRDEGHIWKWFATGIEVVEAVAENLSLDPKYAAMAYELMLEMVKRGAEPGKSVVCHCDLWCNNIMFRRTADDDEKPACRFIDFQMVSYNSYMLDLLCLVCVNSSEEPREYLRVYQCALAETLRRHAYPSEKIPSLDDVLRDYERERIFGLVNAAQSLPMTFMFGEFAAEFVPDDKTFEYYVYNSRADLVARVMERDQGFRCRVEDAVRELIGYMESREKK